jgi:hypothetical protein
LDEMVAELLSELLVLLVPDEAAAAGLATTFPASGCACAPAPVSD